MQYSCLEYGDRDGDAVASCTLGGIEGAVADVDQSFRVGGVLGVGGHADGDADGGAADGLDLLLDLATDLVGAALGGGAIEAGIRIRNSSPPQRQTMSPARAFWTSTSETCTSTRSPASWP